LVGPLGVANSVVGRTAEEPDDRMLRVVGIGDEGIGLGGEFDLAFVGDGGLLDIGQEMREPEGVNVLVAGAIGGFAGRQGAANVVILLEGESDLFNLRLTGHAPGGLAGELDGGEEKSDEDTDDENCDEKFYESKTKAM
jgi:hypothetical protein